MSLIATVMFHIRIPQESHPLTEAYTYIDHVVGATLKNQETRLDPEKDLLVDWRKLQGAAPVRAPDKTPIEGEYFKIAELCLNIDANQPQPLVHDIAADALNELLEEALYHPADNPDSAVIDYTFLKAEKGVTYTDQYEESDAWVFPEYRAAFLETAGIATPAEDLESIIEQRFIAGEMTAQKAARRWLAAT